MELKQLGSKVTLPESPDKAVLERIQVKTPAIRNSVVQFSCPEFTSLCPVTGQPDFARIYIFYIPDKWLIESKALKLFMGSFRNHGAFHEECTTYIATRLREFLEPQWMRVAGIWFPRGGIPIDIFWQTGPAPSWAFIPPMKFYPYDGRH